MNGGDILFDALNGVSDRYVLEAGDLLRIGEEKPHGRGKAKLWKTALLAAALALLLAAAAYAAGLLHWKDQTYSIEGTNRVIVVPNGLRGTKTYEGTAAWWTWAAAQRKIWTEPDWSFTHGDDALRKICETYRATTPEAAAKLREIAETYGLELYSESFPLTGRDELYDRSGMQPYVKDGTDELQSGYIFPDGSFYAEGCLAFGETRLPVTLQRVSTGALYPFGFNGFTDTFITLAGRYYAALGWTTPAERGDFPTFEDGARLAYLCRAVERSARENGVWADV